MATLFCLLFASILGSIILKTFVPRFTPTNFFLIEAIKVINCFCIVGLDYKMPPKAAAGVAAARNVKKIVAKVDHRNRVFTYIPAQLASAAPPLGTQLGNIGVNIAAFVKDFNLKTSIYREGTPIPCVINLNPDRTHKLTMNHPPWSYFIMQAAGIQRGAMRGWEQTAGLITRKHVYEIAKIKSQDEMWQVISYSIT